MCKTCSTLSSKKTPKRSNSPIRPSFIQLERRNIKKYTHFYGDNEDDKDNDDFVSGMVNQ